MSVTVRITERPERTLRVQAYIPEVIRGLSVTTRQMLRNLFGGKDITTIQYPEVKRRYQPQAASVEIVFVNVNPQSTLLLGVSTCNII
jgi:crossover junction endodeoxyribonuclease RuvC